MIRQIPHDPFDYLDSVGDLELAHRTAKEAQLATYHQMRVDPGFEDVRRSTLRNQLEPYQSYGVPGRGTRHVYYVHAREVRPRKDVLSDLRG